MQITDFFDSANTNIFHIINQTETETKASRMKTTQLHSDVSSGDASLTCNTPLPIMPTFDWQVPRPLMIYRWERPVVDSDPITTDTG